MIIPDDCYASESHIVWLHPKENYEYLRECYATVAFRERFPTKSIANGKCTDGGDQAHLVAYAVLKKDAPQARMIGRGYFERRYWWVKGYDIFKGSTHKKPYELGSCPCEAVDVDSIVAGQPSCHYSYDERLLSV